MCACACVWCRFQEPSTPDMYLFIYFWSVVRSTTFCLFVNFSALNFKFNWNIIFIFQIDQFEIRNALNSTYCVPSSKSSLASSKNLAEYLCSYRRTVHFTSKYALRSQGRQEPASENAENGRRTLYRTSAGASEGQCNNVNLLNARINQYCTLYLSL